MILWLALFLLVVAISFVLAYHSMQDYQDIPTQADWEYGLFLIRNTSSLTPDLLDSIHSDIVKPGLIVSFERLFKGQSTALTMFGPKKVLLNYETGLNLLELEDYAPLEKGHLYGWEVGTKDPSSFSGVNIDNFFKNFPKLTETEQFWWQLILKAKKGKQSEPKLFISQIRAVVISDEAQRRKSLTESLQNLAYPNSDQIIDFYKQRILGQGVNNPDLTGRQIVRLVLLKSP